MYDLVKNGVMNLKNDKRGVTAVEYAVIAGVLVASIGLGFTAFAGTISSYLAGLAL